LQIQFVRNGKRSAKAKANRERVVYYYEKGYITCAESSVFESEMKLVQVLTRKKRYTSSGIQLKCLYFPKIYVGQRGKVL
jgi:hypothetical protein